MGSVNLFLLFRYLQCDGDLSVGGDIDGFLVGKARVLEVIDRQHVAGFTGELHGATAVGATTLHEEAVVISDQVPNESLGHFSISAMWGIGLTVSGLC